MNYQEAIAYLLALPDMERASTGPLARVMSMDAMRQLLVKLNNPQLGRRTIHVTGSKGKGSTSTIIAALLQEAGYSVGLYTSPHLHDYTERLSFDLKPCSCEDFAWGVQTLQSACDFVHESKLGPISTFGAMTALFFLLAKKKLVDWQVVEVGMGGATDATNVFTNKEVAVITPISLEHTNVLGSTVEEIAANKAGIITPGAAVILAPQQNKNVYKIIKNKCAEVGAELIDVAACYKLSAGEFDDKHQQFTLEGPRQTRHCTLSLLGEHQLDNAMTAFATCDYLTSRKSIANFVHGSSLARLHIPGRLEVLSNSNNQPLVIVDGAHNGESAHKLACALRRHFQFDNGVIVIGVNNDKNISDILTALKTVTSKLIITSSTNNKAMPPEKIAKAAAELSIPYEIRKDTKDALTLAYSWTQEKKNTNNLICVTGSFYLVAEAREYLLRKKQTNTK